ncbi:MAG TPA: ACP S-malonyltransferase [Gemmatimonadaceae bacterium]|nr:ACP S-malonyltransferase [Gemmatimonadaceae bacterium]
MNVVLVFPGQGSQKPGMAKDVAEAFPAARAVLDAADKALGVPLSTLMFDGPAEELTLTHNAQPALFAHGAAVWAAVKEELQSKVVAAAGHSLGEFTAYHAAGSLSVEDAVRLVRRRGELMYETGVKRPGAMAALLGETSRPIEEICDEATKAAGTVVPANFNCPGQVVISGESAGVDKAMELAKASGAKRAIRLNVSGAFHSPLMEPARDGLREALATVQFRDPAFDVYANVNGQAVRDAATARQRLLDQLVSPVRWTEEVTEMARRHPDATFVEMGPGNVLAGLVKKIAPGVKTMTCGTAAEVNQLLEASQ